MSAETKIQWCDSTLNFWRGCDKVSPGCKECYITTTVPFRVSGQKHGDPRVLQESAFAEAKRLHNKPLICNECGAAYSIAAFNGKEECPCSCMSPCHRRRIFSLSLGDWLDPKVPVEWLARMLDTIRLCDGVIWILCTKRLELWSERLHAAMNADPKCMDLEGEAFISRWLDGDAPNNVILLASVENQEMANLRVPQLLKTPAICRGLSLEPLLGEVDLTDIVVQKGKGEHHFNALSLDGDNPADDNDFHGATLDWLIVGGESGSRARECRVEWIRSLVKQGSAAGIPTFVKQLGANLVCRNDNGFDGESPTEFPMDTHTRDLEPRQYQGAPVRVLLKHSKGGNPDEWPKDLRVREFPKRAKQ